MKLCIILVGFSAVLPVSAAPMYSVINIGGAGGSLSEAFAISASGAVSGTALDAHSMWRGFSNNGVSAILDAGTDVRGINSNGEVVGTQGGQATVWRDGSAQAVGSLGGSGSYGLGISEAGHITGAAVNANGELHAFLSFNGHMLDVGTLGGNWSAGYGVNGAGQVAGYSMTVDGKFAGFRWDQSNGMRRLAGPSGSEDSRGFGINATGAVAGAYFGSGRQGRAAMWDSDGVVVDLGSFGGASYAYGINDEGWVVGFSYDDLGRQRAFVWTGGILYDLNQIVSDTDWSFTAAYAINASGQIAGTGYYKGRSSAFRLDPVAQNRPAAVVSDDLSFPAETAFVSAVPEPSTVMPVLFTLGFFAHRRRKR